MRLLPLLCLLGCATPGARSKGFEAAVSTRDALDAAFEPRRVAVLWGVDRYDDATFPALKWASRDAAELARVLGDPASGGFDRVVLLSRPDEVRRDRILAELAALKADLRRQDSLVVYASSHGTVALGPDAEPHLYLVARDTRPADLRGTGIELDELQRFFSSVRAERKALILDACYNGEAKSTVQPTVQQRVARLDAPPTLSRNVRLGESEAHLFASTFGRPAREDDALRHGVYTYHLLDALTWSRDAADRDDDGVVSVYEAHDHARAATLGYTAQGQVPEAYFRMVGQNDLILAGSEAARRQVETSAVYHYGPAGDAWDGAELLVDGRAKGRFPGTVPVAVGRHALRVVATTGQVLQDRVVALQRGEALAAETLDARPPVRAAFLSAAPVVRMSPSDGLALLQGRAHGGVEVAAGGRFAFGPRGLTLSASVGWAPHQARLADGRFAARQIVWGSAGAGARVVLPRVWVGASLRARVTVVSPLAKDACAAAACEGWVIPAGVAQLEQLVPLGDRLRLLLQQDAGLSVLDAGTGRRPAVDLGLRVGVEVGF